MRAMYVIEAGEEVRIAITKSQNRLSFVFVSKRQITSLYSLFKVTINYLAMAEEGGEVKEVRQKYLRCVI